MDFFIPSVDSLSPGPAAPAAGWWSCLPGSTPPVTQCRRGHSRSPASFPGGSCVHTNKQSVKRMRCLHSGATVNLYILNWICDITSCITGINGLSYWFQLCHVPFQVLGYVHHLGYNVLQLLRWDHRRSLQAQKDCVYLSVCGSPASWCHRLCLVRTDLMSSV